MFTHNVIKKLYSRDGYLPDYPYHLFSDDEMFEAFIGISSIFNDNGEISDSVWEDVTSSYGKYFFFDNYPLIDISIQDSYKTLIYAIASHLREMKNNDDYILPNWIYSYMLGECIGPNSPTADIHDTLVLLGCDNTDDMWTLQACNNALHFSAKQILKLKDTDKVNRPPTMFGEPHVLKYLRLRQLS